jgi:hypothetical protein
MFSWWKKQGVEPSITVAELPKPFAQMPKHFRKQNRCFAASGTTEVATEPATVPAADCASQKGSVEKVISELFELNWNWVLPKPFEQDVVRVLSANAPPACRQPTAREHAVELLRVLQSQPRLVGKWILATDLEHEVYPNLLACLGWAPRPWIGRNGVAKHLGHLTLRRYKRVEVAGSKHNWAAFFVPGKSTGGVPRRELNRPVHAPLTDAATN